MTKKRLRTAIKSLVVIAFCGAIGSCTNHDLEDVITQYQSRLSNILQQPLPPQHTPLPQLNYPKMALLKSQLPQMTIDLTTLAKLQPCGAATLIANRNTALGKTQLPSFRYIYEVNVIEALKYCVDSNPSLAENLDNWIRMKQHALPLVWADLVQTSKEMRYAMTNNGGFIDHKINYTQAIHAFQYLDTLYQQPSNNQTLLETHLAILKQTQLPAKMLRSQRLFAEQLALTTQWLKQHTQQFTCQAPKQKQQARYLANVFELFFVAQLQPTASQLHHYHYQLTPTWNLWLANPHLKKEFKALLQQQISSFNQYQTKMKNHIEYWQELFKKCDITIN